MSAEGPKLLNNKPKKSKLKASTPITMASPSSTGAAATPPTPPPPPPPPQSTPPLTPPKESFARRYRFLWPVLLAVNFSIGAYVLLRTTSKGTSKSETESPDSPTSTPTSTVPTATVTENPVTKPVNRAPIPEDQQRELFKWMLEEKRKVKPRDAEEKKRIDEEKAVLKQFIRAKSIPSL